MIARIALALLAASSLVAPATADPETAPATATQPAPEKKTCRKETTTGSRMSKRTCMTAAEWAQQDAKSKNWVDGTINRASGLAVQN